MRHLAWGGKLLENQFVFEQLGSERLVRDTNKKKFSEPTC